MELDPTILERIADGLEEHNKLQRESLDLYREDLDFRKQQLAKAHEEQIRLMNLIAQPQGVMPELIGPHVVDPAEHRRQPRHRRPDPAAGKGA